MFCVRCVRSLVFSPRLDGCRARPTNSSKKAVSIGLCVVDVPTRDGTKTNDPGPNSDTKTQATTDTKISHHKNKHAFVSASPGQHGSRLATTAARSPPMTFSIFVWSLRCVLGLGPFASLSALGRWGWVGPGMCSSSCTALWASQHPRESSRPYWRWEPEKCTLEEFTAEGFCRAMEGRKGLLLVGGWT